MLQDPVAVRVAGADFVSGTLDGRRTVLAASAIGKVNGAVVTTVLADRFSCAPIVFSGVAGGIDPHLNVGDVVIADRVIQHDAGIIDNGRFQIYQAGRLPFINPGEELGFRADPTLLERVSARLRDVALPVLSEQVTGVRRRAPRIAVGTVLSGDQFLRCEDTRARWYAEFGGRAVEMEGGAVAQAAAAFGVPWLVIRSLSDLAGHDSTVDFRAFVDHAALTSMTVVRHLLPVL